MKQAPSIFRLAFIANQLSSHRDMVQIGDHWAPARPLGFFSIGNRLKCAWLVFTGKADALIWPQDEK